VYAGDFRQYIQLIPIYWIGKGDKYLYIYILIAIIGKMGVFCVVISTTKLNIDPYQDIDIDIRT
jgi:hypothetical protein